MSTSLQGYNPSGAPAQERPEGAFTGRIRSLADNATGTAERLTRVLHTLRGAPPPSPAEAGKIVRQSCIEDYLGQNESSNKNIEDMLNEIERLIG